MIPEPEVKVFDLQESDQFMIMASDGVWEFISSQVRSTKRVSRSVVEQFHPVGVQIFLVTQRLKRHEL